jgi:hypothetical protein
MQGRDREANKERSRRAKTQGADADRSDRRTQRDNEKKREQG